MINDAAIKRIKLNVSGESEGFMEELRVTKQSLRDERRLYKDLSERTARHLERLNFLETQSEDFARIIRLQRKALTDLIGVSDAQLAQQIINSALEETKEHI